MGVCLSRCGDKQAAPVVTAAAAAATDDILETKITAAASPFDPNLSLKRFLHLNQEPKKLSTSTPRTSSLAESVAIPHSSELFSLPDSELGLRSSFALSPAGAPRRAPSDGASISSLFASNSPRRGCSKKRIRPARGEQVDLAARQRLVDAITRLERLNDAGKPSILGLRGPSFCSSGMAPVVVPVMEPKSSSGELKRPARSRHVRHYQLPLPKSTMCSSKDIAKAAISHHPTGNLDSLDTTPAVTDFLRTVETFVSLIEAPRELQHQEPKTTVPTTITNRRKIEDADSEEMLTFEFGASEVRNQSKQSPVRMKTVSLQRLVQSTTQASHGQKSLEPEVAMPVVESAKAMSREWKSPSSTWQPVELFVKQSGTAFSTSAAPVSTDPCMKSLREEEADAAARRPAQDRNAAAMRKAKSPRFPLRMRPLKGLTRGLSRSLDSIESSVIQVDLEIFKNQRATPIAATRLSSGASPSEHPTEATLIGAKRVELELLPVSSTQSCKLEPSARREQKELEENCCTGFLDASTIAELANSEIVLPQEVPCLVEDALPTSTVSAESEPASNLDNAPETKRMRCEETLSDERTECSGSQTAPTVRNYNDSPSSHITQVVLSPPSNGGDSQRFGLLEAFHSLLKLLLVSNTEQPGAACTAAAVDLDPDEENKSGFRS